MRSKIDPEAVTIQGCPKPSGDPLSGLGVSGGALLEISGAMWSRFLAKLGRRWARDGRKMGQVGSKLRPRWAMIAPRWPCWGQLGSFWEGPGNMFDHFFHDLWKNGRSVKTTNAPSLLVFFGGFGLPLEGPGGCLGRILGAIVEDVGSKMVFSWLS